MFFNYRLHNSNDNKQTTALGDSFVEKIRELEEERFVEKQKRSEARGIIAKIKNIDESGIPLTGNDFYSWVRENILHGMSLGDVDKARKKGIKISIQPKIENSLRQIVASNKKIQEIDTEINRYNPKTTITTTSKNIIREAMSKSNGGFNHCFLPRNCVMK